MTWKKVECPFEKDRKILQYLLTAPVFTEDGKFTSKYINYLKEYWHLVKYANMLSCQELDEN